MPSRQSHFSWVGWLPSMEFWLALWTSSWVGSGWNSWHHLATQRREPVWDGGSRESIARKWREGTKHNPKVIWVSEGSHAWLEWFELMNPFLKFFSMGGMALGIQSFQREKVLTWYTLSRITELPWAFVSPLWNKRATLFIRQALCLDARTMLWRATQDRCVMVESSDKTWSTGEGNGKPLQYPCLQNPMNSVKRQKDKILEDESPQVNKCPICFWGRAEKLLHKEWRDQAKAKITLSCGCIWWWK